MRVSIPPTVTRPMRLRSLLSVGVASTTGCHRRRAEGPAERAGKKVDSAADKTKEAAKDVKEDIKKQTK